MMCERVPVTVVENFLRFPHAVKTRALEFEYTRAPDGRWPGVRTGQLRDIWPDLNSYVVRMVYHILGLDSTAEIDVDMSFQKVSKEFGDSTPVIHTDGSAIAGILYLTETADGSAGTNFYEPTKDFLPNEELAMQKCKAMVANDFELLRSLRNELNKNLKPTIKVSDVFNRLVLFDGKKYHAANGFDAEGGEDRLTLVFFLYVRNTSYPTQRASLDSDM